MDGNAPTKDTKERRNTVNKLDARIYGDEQRKRKINKISAINLDDKKIWIGDKE